MVVTNIYTTGMYNTGYIKPTTPRWAPNGRSIAFLKREAGVTQIYVVGLDGAAAVPVTQSPTDIDEFGWTPDGKSLVYKTQAERIAAQVALEREGLTGWHYDDRFSPVAQNRPYPPPLSDDDFTIEIGQSARPATPEERVVLDPEVKWAENWNLQSSPIRSISGEASIQPADPNIFASPSTIRYTAQSGDPINCAYPTCNGRLQGLWPRPDGAGFLFSRREGHGESRLGFYTWNPEQGAPRRLLGSDDYFLGCQISGDKLVCAHESSSTPRKIVSIDPDTGVLTTLFDPNPEFASLRLGAVRRLHWTTPDRESYGDLVLPPDHKPGDQHPLVIVGYETRGFLRGGTGDEHPIFALAARGFAVLSYQAGPINRPPSATLADYLRADMEAWASRRSMFAVLQAGITAAKNLEVIDERHIGITGFSEGGGNAIYALIKAPELFSAASLSPCCESAEFISLNGPGFGNQILRASGWPKLTQPDPAFWAEGSLAQNAERVTAPILLQVADREFLYGISTFQARLEVNRLFDMYVFPNEYHYKHQPAHRLAVYKRNIDWFDFWLRDRRSTDPARADELDRWEAMREANPGRHDGVEE
jgi:dipeptidyl aminopeptidase/acylaminoacyl peptidase